MSSVQRLTASFGRVVEVGSRVAVTTGVVVAAVVAAEVDVSTADAGESPVSDAHAPRAESATTTVHA